MRQRSRSGSNRLSKEPDGRRASLRPERYLTHGRLDLELARIAAPLAAFDNLTDHDFYSARIGCQTYGINGMDLAALCIKRTQRPSSRHG